MSTSGLERERQRFLDQLQTAHQLEDPLVVYNDFIQWTRQAYPPSDANSGLIELLEETTRKFKDDDAYKSDRRYLDIWIMYANEVDKASEVYKFCAKRGIGLMWGKFYEEYARVLEMNSNRTDAERVYKMGIKRNARPVDRLKSLYAEFQTRPLNSTFATRPKSSHPIRRNPLRNHISPETTTSSRPTVFISSSPSSSLNSEHNRYAVMLSPPPPGKRPERLRFDLSLLFSPETCTEYSAAEVRARCLGLLGKKWGPLPEVSLPAPSDQVKVKFDDDTRANSTKIGSRRKSMLTGEPTVTINTKEALADVFGMYNSPDKTTMNLEKATGSKHAPVKNVGAVTPSTEFRVPLTPLPLSNANEGMKAAAFRPFVDENAAGSARKENSKPRPPISDVVDNFSSGSDARADQNTSLDGKMSFRVFSRPEKGFTPKSGMDFTDGRDCAERPALGDLQPTRTGEDFDEEDEVRPYRVPLGGRFGQFNVMTPITERTFEFTTSMRGDATPRSPFEPFVDAGGLAEEGVTMMERRNGTDDSDDEGEGMEVAMAAIEEKTGTLSLIDALQVSSSFKPPNPCVPFDPPIMATLLSLIPTDPGYHDLRDKDAKLLDGLQKFSQKKRKMSGNSTSNLTMDMSQRYDLVVADRKFEVEDKLGEGAFGSVFAARDVDTTGVQDEDEMDEDEDDSLCMVAIKVVKPRNLWEYHVLRRIHCTLPSHLRRSVVTPHALYAFRDESFMILCLSPQGTLLDIVNRASQAGVAQQGACLDELLVMFFTIELLRFLEGLHGAGFIHGDLKIDNCLLRLEDVPGGASAWSNVYQSSGQGGWSSKGLKVIDFGRTIDTRLFPLGQTFVSDWEVDARDCPEMRENMSWTFQPDYFGLAGIIYCMLFGKYIESSSVTTTSLSGVGQRYKIATAFKRYWQVELWTNLFDILLNPCSIRADHHLPLCEELGEIRQEMEKWLQNNCNRAGNTLKGLLKKIEVATLR